MYCPKCGKQNDKTNSFCRYCGFNLNSDHVVKKYKPTGKGRNNIVVGPVISTAILLIIFGIFLIRDNLGLSSYSNDSLLSISDSIEEENDSINAKLDSNIVFYDFLTHVSDGKINRHIAWDYNKMVSIDFVDADITKKSDGYNIKAYVVQVGGDFETPDEYLYEIEMYMSADSKWL